ncbi:MAG: PH domain-containing protein [Acidimicrobiales bacterium]
MPFSKKLLNEGEDIVLDLHPHWEYFLREGLALVAALALGIFMLISSWEGVSLAVAGVLVLAALVWVGLTYASWVTTHFVVTTDRLIYRHGVLSKHGIEIPLERVNTVFFSQTVVERMFGSGDLVIESAGEMGRQSFSNVRKPSAIQNEIYKQMEANENRKFDRIGARPAASASIPEQITQLDQLRQQGLLTQAEFDQKKKQLLDKM